MPKILGRDGFKNDDRSPNAAVGHAHRVSKGDAGEPVGRIRAFRPMDADPLAIEATPPPVEPRERAADRRRAARRGATAGIGRDPSAAHRIARP